MHPSPLSTGEGEDLRGLHLSEGVTGKERGNFFQGGERGGGGGLQFYKKNKMKSEIFDDKKRG